MKIFLIYPSTTVHTPIKADWHYWLSPSFPCSTQPDDEKNIMTSKLNNYTKEKITTLSNRELWIKIKSFRIGLTQSTFPIKISVIYFRIILLNILVKIGNMISYLDFTCHLICFIIYQRLIFFKIPHYSIYII